MKRKYLLLLLIPVALFGVHQVWASWSGEKGPNGKTELLGEKPKTKNTEVVFSSEVKQEMKKEREAAAQYPFWEEWDSLAKPYETEVVSESLRAFMEKELVQEIYKAKIVVRDHEMFSRCPSGVTWMVRREGTPDQDKEGFLIDRNGCDENVLAFFLVNEKEKAIWVRLSEKLGYVPVATWLDFSKRVNS